VSGSSIRCAILASTFEHQLEVAIRALSEGLRTRAKELQNSATSLSAADQRELTELESRVALADVSILEDIACEHRNVTRKCHSDRFLI